MKFKKGQPVAVITRTSGLLPANYVKCHPGARGDYHEVKLYDGTTTKVRLSQLSGVP